LTKRPKSLTSERVRTRIARWFRTRLDLDPVIALIRRKPIPIHRHSWMYALGDTAGFLFLLQLASGCLLMLYYQPTEASAHESVRRIMTEVPYGWLIRSMHVWGASFYIGVACLHLLTVFFAGAYRRPRELVWVSGVVMLFLALASGFSGYLLPWNELSFFATTVGTEIPGTLLGDSVVHFLRGGDQVTGATITRFFAAHVMILPLTFALAVSIHVFLSRVRGVSLPVGMPREKVKDYRPFASEFLLIEVCLWLVLAGTLVTLAVLLPAEVGVRASLEPAPKGIKPEWYFLFMYQAIQLVPEMVGVVFFALCALALLGLPFLDRSAMRDKRSPVLTWVFLAFVGGAVALEVWALLTPGLDHPPERFTADTYSLSAGIISLALVWSVIGFLIFYLRQLLNENRRIRELREGKTTCES
jgi:cytochrome b6